MEEVGRVDRAGPDPLHLLENAHAVVEGLGPGVTRPGDDVPRVRGDRLGERWGLLVERGLGIEEQLRQPLELGHLGRVVVQRAGARHDRQRQEQGLEVERLARGVVLGKVHQAHVGLGGQRAVGVTREDEHPCTGSLHVVEDREALGSRAGEGRDHHEGVSSDDGRPGHHQLGRQDHVGAETRPVAEEVCGRLHEDAGATGPGEDHVGHAGVEGISDHFIDLRCQPDGT